MPRKTLMDKQRVSFRQLLKCQLLRSLAYVRALPRHVREARKSPFYRHARDTWPGPRRAASAAAIVALLLWIGSLAPLYVFSETSLPTEADEGSTLLWGVLAARMLIALALVTTAAFCGARAFGPERDGRCMEQMILLPLNRPRLLLARMLPALEPLLACAAVLFLLDLVGVLTAALLHGNASAARHLILPVFVISGVIYSTAACSGPMRTGMSVLMCAGTLWMNLYLALVVTFIFAVASCSTPMLGVGRSFIPVLICTSLFLSVFSAVIQVLTHRLSRQVFEPNALGIWGARKRVRWIRARYGRGPVDRYLRQFRWWLFLNEGLSRIIKRRYIRLQRWIRGPRPNRAATPAPARRGLQVKSLHS